LPFTDTTVQTIYTQTMVSKEIVIAAYDKPLDWMSGLRDDVKQTIYRKGDVMPLQENETFIDPNLGRCVHTFFNHIYTNYDKLSDITFFAQDYPFDHWGDLIEVVHSVPNMRVTLEIPTGYYGFHNNTLGTSWSLLPSRQVGKGGVLNCISNGNPQDTNPLINVDKYWDILFDCPKPLIYEFMPGGHFGVTKEHARLRSKELYKKITDLLVEDPTAPWMIERLECYIFNPTYKTRI
jgi:hypothetical protein